MTGMENNGKSIIRQKRERVMERLLRGFLLVFKVIYF